MSFDQMLSMYMRLRQDLADAYAAPLWNEGLLERLTGEIAQVERAMARTPTHDEQTNDVLPNFVKVAFGEDLRAE